MARKRILIVGGVAAGATAAVRARRLDEASRIILFERGPYVSFANCGLPYHLSGVIADEATLLLSSPEQFAAKFDIDVRVRSEVLAIDRKRREVRVRDHDSGRVYVEGYDALVLAPGGKAFQPAVPGIDRPGVFLMRTVPDVRKVRSWIEARSARRAVVVGAGFIGLEVAENLARRGLEVSVLEAGHQVFSPLDREMAAPVARHLEQNGIHLHLGHGLQAIDTAPDGTLLVTTAHEVQLHCDLVILALGTRPEITLAQEAGLAIGAGGGVVVDASMQTSDPHIWAAGDVVEHRCLISDHRRTVPLAGLANRQGRIVADSVAGREVRLRGMQGTFICELFGLTIAATGLAEKQLRALGRSDFAAVWLHPKHHVTYYPGAEPVHLKIVYSTEDGKVLGAQAVGKRGVDKRIDVIAMAIQLGATVYDLEQAELAYSPQFGSAKDPVNLAGMVAANHLRGDVQHACWEELPASAPLLIDVREHPEFESESIQGAKNVPLSELRSRTGELPRDKELWLYCESGKRSYDAARLLSQLGHRVRVLPGGIVTARDFGVPLQGPGATAPAPASKALRRSGAAPQP